MFSNFLVFTHKHHKNLVFPPSCCSNNWIKLAPLPTHFVFLCIEHRSFPWDRKHKRGLISRSRWPEFIRIHKPTSTILSHIYNIVSTSYALLPWNFWMYKLYIQLYSIIPAFGIAGTHLQWKFKIINWKIFLPIILTSKSNLQFPD